MLITGFTLLGAPRPAAIAAEAAHEPASLELEHGLEGMQFVGPLGARGETSPPDDLLTFNDGMFTSKICLEYGFEPAPYWVRRDADGIHFRVEARSPEHGTMRIEGVFDGEEMKAGILWVKERWYWTIEQELVFTGRPVEQAR